MPYIDFLQYCLDDHKELPVSANYIDWSKMLAWAEQQAIVGIIYDGITDVRCQREDGKSRLQIPSEILIKWIGYANQIKNRNQLLNKRCVELTERLRNEGFDCCILKGQGNAVMYGSWFMVHDEGEEKKEEGRSLALLRTPGDIDVWVMPGERLRCNGSRLNAKEVIRLAREKNPSAKVCYHHVDYGDFKGVEVEIHYRPSFMFNPLHNCRLQRWFMVHDEGFMVELPENAGTIRVPNWEFNIVFQLSHVYNHLLHEGIGLRQVIDYYYLLKSNTNRTNDTNIQDTLRNLGLEKIAGAMMWVLNKILGLDEEYLIAPKNEKCGKVLLAEIMKGGNFGHCDVENQKATTAIQKNILRIKRDLRMMRYFPSECLWEPVFRTWHYFWRQFH